MSSREDRPLPPRPPRDALLFLIGASQGGNGKGMRLSGGRSAGTSRVWARSRQAELVDTEAGALEESDCSSCK
jgi:hypothetical protein